MYLRATYYVFELIFNVLELHIMYLILCYNVSELYIMCLICFTFKEINVITN